MTKKQVKPLAKKMSNKRVVKKTLPIQMVEKEEEKVLISESDVWDVLKFASSIYQGGVYTPQLINQRLQDVTMSPQMATAEKIDSALLDPTNSEEELIGYSQFFELTNMLYKRTMYYLSGMLSFDVTYLPMNADEKDLEKPLYKSDLKIVTDFLDRFDIKKEFGTVVRQLIRNETFFSVFRDDGAKYTLQELNQEYCIITGKWDYGYLFDFNMQYFLNPSVDINMFPPVFKKMFRNVFKETDSYKKYIPSNPVVQRDGSWVLWNQTSPMDGFFCFKFNPELASRIPFLSPMMPDLVIQPIVRKLQTNSYIAAASKIIMGKIPLLSKDVKGGAVRDSVAVSPELLGKFLGLIKAGLPDAIKVAAAPLEDMKSFDFPLGQSNFYEDYLKTTTATSGVNSRLIFTLDKNNSTESQLSINVDEMLMTHLYPYFTDFLEFQINKKTKKYKWKFFLEGTEFFTNRKERLDTQTTLMGYGIVLPQKIAASIGMLPHHFEKALALGKASDFVKKLTPIVMNAQLPAEGSGNSVSKDKSTGRPKKSQTELSDSGVQTRDDGQSSE